MNSRGCRQSLPPLPDLSRKIEGDSVRRVVCKAITFSCAYLSLRVWFLHYVVWFLHYVLWLLHYALQLLHYVSLLLHYVLWFLHYVVCSLRDVVSSLCFVDFTSGTKLQYPGLTRYQELVKPVLRGAPFPALPRCQR